MIGVRSISTRLYRRHAQTHPGAMKRSPSLETQIPEESAVTTMDQGYKMTGETGSYRYMAPEVFRHEIYNEKVDVYAFAMIFYELLEGIPPFIDHDPISAATKAAIGHSSHTIARFADGGHLWRRKLSTDVEL